MNETNVCVCRRDGKNAEKTFHYLFIIYTFASFPFLSSQCSFSQETAAHL